MEIRVLIECLRNKDYPRVVLVWNEQKQEFTLKDIQNMEDEDETVMCVHELEAANFREYYPHDILHNLKKRLEFKRKL